MHNMFKFGQKYKQLIASTYASLSYARLSNPGELIDRSFSLQDIFFPTRMTTEEEYSSFNFLSGTDYLNNIDKMKIREDNHNIIREELD